MIYSKEQINQLNIGFEKTKESYKKLLIDLPSAKFQNERANEFFYHGVFRRLQMIYHCTERIFEIYPPQRVKVLEDNERLDIESFLQTFIINVYGIIDNLALVVNEEKDINLNRREVSLFNKEIKKHLSNVFLSYIKNKKTGGFRKWYDRHCSLFRHSLGHRIPLYVPPSGINNTKRYEEIFQEKMQAIKSYQFEEVERLENEEKNLEEILPFYIQSFIEESPKVYIHPQLIADLNTIIELIENFETGFIYKS